jgi:hypothetical protein
MENMSERQDKQLEEKKMKEKNLDYLYQRRERLDGYRFELSNSLDKYLFIASTGTLSIIIGFVGKLESLQYFPIFLLAIIFLFLCVITTLLSIQFSIKAHKQQVTITDQEINLEQGQSNEICRANYWNNAVRWSSMISSLFFIIGGLIAAIFYLINI